MYETENAIVCVWVQSEREITAEMIDSCLSFHREHGSYSWQILIRASF